MMVLFFVVFWVERGKVVLLIVLFINSVICVVVNMNIFKGIFIVNKNYYFLEIMDYYV